MIQWQRTHHKNMVTYVLKLDAGWLYVTELGILRWEWEVFIKHDARVRVHGTEITEERAKACAIAALALEKQ